MAADGAGRRPPRERRTAPGASTGTRSRTRTRRGTFVTASGGFSGAERQRPVGHEDVQARRLRPDAAVLPPREPRHQGGRRVRAGHRGRRPELLRRTPGASCGQLVQTSTRSEGGPNIYSHIFFASLDSTVDNPVSAPLIADPEHDVYSAFRPGQLEGPAEPDGQRRRALGAAAHQGRARTRRAEARSRRRALTTYININHFSPRVGVVLGLPEGRQDEGLRARTASSSSRSRWT